jgi:hypothetical protein
MLKKSFSSKIVNKSFCVIPSFENCVVTLMVFFLLVPFAIVYLGEKSLMKVVFFFKHVRKIVSMLVNFFFQVRFDFSL